MNATFQAHIKSGIDWVLAGNTSRISNNLTASNASSPVVAAGNNDGAAPSSAGLAAVPVTATWTGILMLGLAFCSIVF